jgi:hypothetical protein
MSGWLHAPAALPQEATLVSTLFKIGWGPEPIWTLRRKRKSPSPA